MWWDDIAKIVPMGKFSVLNACIREKKKISFQSSDSTIRNKY